jgi:hypothetical protein
LRIFGATTFVWSFPPISFFYERAGIKYKTVFWLNNTYKKAIIFPLVIVANLQNQKSTVTNPKNGKTKQKDGHFPRAAKASQNQNLLQYSNQFYLPKTIKNQTKEKTVKKFNFS